jgi:hypothetical protein
MEPLMANDCMNDDSLSDDDDDNDDDDTIVTANVTQCHLLSAYLKSDEFSM